ncbi:MAG: endolytic transglycosylase MltG [Acetobacter sp.]
MASKRKSRTPQPPARKGRFFLLRWLAAFSGLGLLGLAAIGAIAWHDYTRPGPLATGQDIVIHRGGYTATLATLQETGVLRPGSWTGRLFQLSIALTRKDGQIHAAELHFPAQVSMSETLWILRHGKPVLHRLTVPEGLTAYDITNLLLNAPFLTADISPPAEGSALPQTYTYLRDEPRADVLARMQAKMASTLASIWQDREPGLPLQSPQDLLVLASLVEKETAVPAERPLVARVLVNRLQKGMKLQTDPTVIYALTQGRPPLGRALTHTDLQTPSAYNTYLNTGLPPGPICSPGLAALEAAAHPAQSNALYFVANGTGGHNFAATLSEHNKNVSLFRAQQSGR